LSKLFNDLALEKTVQSGNEVRIEDSFHGTVSGLDTEERSAKPILTAVAHVAT
jgi:hypothetical protein